MLSPLLTTSDASYTSKKQVFNFVGNDKRAIHDVLWIAPIFSTVLTY